MNSSLMGRKERKEFLKLLEKQFGFTSKLDFAFFVSEKGRIYACSKEIGLLDLANIRVNSVGVYIGEISHGEARLSIEGSQMVGPHSTRGVVDVSDAEARLWIKGNDLEKKSSEKGFVLIKNNDDFLGCGRVKDSVILNMIPKARYLKVSD